MTTTTPARGLVSHGPAFWIVFAAFAVAMAFSTIPTPLYAIYQAKDGFPTWMITVIFAAYAVGVAASLYLVGHVSDWLGRRRIIIAALATEILAAAVFLFWPEVPGLIVARFVSGVGIGALTATATAHLSELRAVARPGSTAAAMFSSLANIGGLAFGPLVAGILAQFVSGPLVVPYVVFVALLALALLAVAVVPETIVMPERSPRYRPQRVTIPAADRERFWAAGAGVVGAFAIFGLFTSLTPTVLGVVMGQHSRLVAGLVTFAVFGAAAVAQLVTVRMPPRRQLILAFVVMVVGIVLLAIAVLTASLALFVVSGIVAGAGVGVMFRSSLGVAASLAPPESRGEVLAAIFLIAYVGLAVPSLLVGVSLVWLPLTPVLIAFTVLVLALVVWSSPRMIRSR